MATTKPRSRLYRYIHSGAGEFRDVGINADGTLHNPRGYPEDVLRAEFDRIADRDRQLRKAAAAKAAITRRERMDRKVYEIANKIQAGHVYGPRDTCVICKRAVSDPPSIDRGIGSDCWQRLLEVFSKRAAEKVAAESEQRKRTHYGYDD